MSNNLLTASHPELAPRIYRTGDLGFALPDGRFQCPGRKDRQIKLHGYRIELGEVEFALGSCQNVEQAVVRVRRENESQHLVAFVQQQLARENWREVWDSANWSEPDPNLAGYIQSRPMSAGEVAHLRSHVGARLPSYMIPTEYIAIDRIPRTPNNKIDTNKLLALQPEENQEHTVRSLVATLAGLSEEVVASARDLIELGFDSLMAVRLRSELAQGFGIEIPLHSLVSGRATLAELERMVEETTVTSRVMGSDAIDRSLVSTSNFALSDSQAEIYAATRLASERNTALYIDHLAFEMQQPVDLERLESAFVGLVDRHPMLRVKIQGDRQSIRSLVEAQIDPPDADYLRPFDLHSDLPIRVAVSADRRRVDLTAHHIVVDGRSLTLLCTELFERYRNPAAFDAKEKQGLSYGHFVSWQKTVRDKHATFWTAELDDAPEAFALPYDYPGTDKRRWTGGTVRTPLAAEIVSSLDALSRSHTLPSVLAALVAVLLQRYTGDRELVLGLLSSGRSRSDWLDIVGHFIKLLPLRISLRDDETITAFATRVGEGILASIEHQDADIPRHKVAAVVNYYELPAIEGAKVIFPEQLNGQFDLAFWFIRDVDGSMHLEVKYCDDRFDRGTAVMMARQLSNILGAAASAPKQTVGSLALQTRDETEVQLARLNATETALDYNQCVHSLIDEIDPELPAMGRISYGELRMRGTGLAVAINRALRDFPKARIGLYMQSGSTLVISILAALKSGRAYVPLDPKYPIVRLQSTISDAEVGIVVTQSSLVREVKERFPDILILDAEDFGAIASTDPVSLPAVKPDDIAYILFTSGTTGRPKGVMVQHRALSNRIQWMQQQYALTTDDAVLQKTPFTFDVSIWEFVWPLTVGARLVPSPPGAYQDPGHLLDLIKEQGVTVMHFVPSMLQVFLQHPRLAPYQLKHAICSGEALSAKLRDRFFSSPLGDVRLHNLYGPTEACIDVTFWECKPEHRGYVPIGRPVANTQLYIVKDGELAAPGCPGELWIGGVQVATGYSNREELTAERFIPNPFGPGIVYRTGDLVRWRQDDTIAYLGRIDRQIKLRGQRIELAEIEAVLSRAPQVERAVVAVDEGGDRQRLLAFLTPDLINIAKVREFAAQRLTPYMMPEGITAQEYLPVSNHGKVDTGALIDGYKDTVTSSDGLTEERQLRALDTDTEKLVAQVMRDVLGDLKTLGKDDDFLAIGGNSLSAIEFVIAIERTLEVTIQLSSILAGPTVERIASHIDSLAPSASSESIDVSRVIVPPSEAGASPVSVPHAYRVTDMQGHMLDCYGRFFHYLARVYVDDERGPFDMERFCLALQSQISRHPPLRAVFWRVNDRWLQGFREPHQLLRPVIDLRKLSASTQEEAMSAAIETWGEQLFLLESGEPLFRIKIFWLRDNRICLAINAHHAVYDGWGEAALMRAIFRDYVGKNVSREALRKTYLERVALEHNAVHNESVRAFWTDYLRNVPVLSATSPLPELASVTLNVSDELVAQIENVQQKLGVTARAVMLSAFTAMIEEYLGDNCVGVVTNTRIPQMSNPLDAVGLYWNILPIRHRAGDVKLLQRELLDMEMDGRAHYPPSLLPQVHRSVFMFTDFAAWHDATLGVRITSKWWRDFQNSRIHATVLWKEGGGKTTVVVNAPATEVEHVCKQYKRALEVVTIAVGNHW